MKTIATYLIIVLSLSAIPASAALAESGAEREVLRDFEQILDLWRDGKYAELYERTEGGRQSKEQFAKKLASAPRKPACCWEKMQDVHITIKSERAALVHARLGFEGPLPTTEFATKKIKLKKEEGVWMISQGELYSLADVSKKGRRYKYLPALGK